MSYRLFPQCRRLGGLFFLLLTLVLPQWGEAQFTTSPVLVASSPFGQDIGNAKLAIDATGTIHVAWTQEVGGIATSGTTMYSRSTDGGMSFIVPVPVPGSGSGGTFLSSLAVDPHGIIFLFLTGTSEDQEPSVFVRVSRDGGQSFPFVTTFGSGAGQSLAIDEAGNVNLVFTGSSSGLRFSRSVDQGSTFSPPQTISCGDFPCPGGAAIGAKVGGLIYILTSTRLAGLSHPYRNWFTRSIDGGATFPPATDFTEIGGGEPWGPFVETSGAIDVLFRQLGGAATGGFTRSIDEGQTFSPPTSVPLSGPFVVDQLGNITVLGFVSGSPTRDIGVSRSINHGATFSASAPLLSDTLAVLSDVQADPGGRVYLLYRTERSLFLTKLIGLLPTLQATPATLESGGTITLRLRVDNLESQPVTNVVPGPIIVGGSGGASLLSGPSPANATIPPGGGQTFDFTFAATSPGAVTFTGGASGTNSTGGLLTTPSVTSSPVQIQAAPTLVITTFRAGPASVNVGGTINGRCAIVS